MSADSPVVNAAQAEAWNGEEGEHWAANDDRYDAMGSVYTDALRPHQRPDGVHLGGAAWRATGQRRPDGEVTPPDDEGGTP